MKTINKGVLTIDNTTMDYVAFGKGSKPLVLVPGLGDGLKTVKGTGFLMSRIYKQFSRDYRVYVFSRRNNLPQNFSTRDMANDLKKALQSLRLGTVDLIGVSQGGMISQFFAIDYPQMVNKLVIAISIAKPNPLFTNVISRWIDLAQKGAYKSLFIDTLEKTYVGKRLKRTRWFYPLLTLFGKPKSFDRFLVQARSCLNHHAYDELEKIKCLTLVVGGRKDQIVGSDSAREIAEKINDADLIEYPKLGHGASDRKVFIEDVLAFLRRDNRR